MAEFSVYGPYDMPFEQAAGGRRLHYDEFWQQSGEVKKLADERGLYVFAIRAGKGFTPIYVGSATKTFSQECFNPTNRHKYLEGMADYRKGSPVMFFLVHPKQKGKTNVRQITEMETFLIQLAAQKNPALQNVKGTAGPEWAIKGVVRSSKGKPSASARKFKRAIGY